MRFLVPLDQVLYISAQLLIGTDGCIAVISGASTATVALKRYPMCLLRWLVQPVPYLLRTPRPSQPSLIDDLRQAGHRVFV